MRETLLMPLNVKVGDVLPKDVRIVGQLPANTTILSRRFVVHGGGAYVELTVDVPAPAVDLAPYF